MPNNPSLSEAVHQAAQPAPAALTEPAAPSTSGKSKSVLLRIDPELHRALRQLAVDSDTTLQALGVEALEALLSARRQ